MRKIVSILGAILTGLLLLSLLNCKKETPKVAPLVSIAEVTTVTGTTATINIDIVSDGGATITERGVCWSTNPNPTINDHKAIVSDAMTFTGSVSPIKAGIISDGNIIASEGSITITISDLLPNKTYYIRAYAVNPVGVGYSEQSTITTLTISPALTTLELSAVTSTTASSGGNITNDGGDAITTRGVCWSLLQNPTIADNKTTDGSGTGSFTSTITGLSPGTRYYFKAYATNSVGTSYGNELTITTSPGFPIVTTKAMTTVYTYSAKGGGNIINGGGLLLMAHGICWSKNPNPTLSDNKSAYSDWLINFDSYMTGLEANTVYYLRAYATNTAGTGYGNEVTIKTNAAVIPTEDYLPLQVGNYWELNNGTYTHTLLIDMVENLDGKDYYRIIRTGEPLTKDTVYLRKTSEGRVYLRGTKSTDEIIRFDFSASSGDIWKYSKDPSTTWNAKPWTAKLINKTDTVRRNTNTFDNCYSYYYDIVEWAGDAEWGYCLAPGIGFVKYVYLDSSTFPQRRLTKVRINGVERVY